MFRNIFTKLHSNNKNISVVAVTKPKTENQKQENISVVAVTKPKTEKTFVSFTGLSKIEHEGVVLRTITLEKAKSEITRYMYVVSVYKKDGVFVSTPYIKLINKSYCNYLKKIKDGILDNIHPQYFDYDWMMNE